MGKWQDGVEGTDGMNGSTLEERRGRVWCGGVGVVCSSLTLCCVINNERCSIASRIQLSRTNDTLHVDVSTNQMN